MIDPPYEPEPLLDWLDAHYCSRGLLVHAAHKNLRELWDTCPRGIWLLELLEYAEFEWYPELECRIIERQKLDHAQYVYKVRERKRSGTFTFKDGMELIAESHRVRADGIRSIIPFPFNTPEDEES